MDERSILTKLYFGEINPSDRWTNNAAHYEEKLKECAQIEGKLLDSFTHEQKKLYEALHFCRHDMDTIELVDKFRYGFRLGLLIGLEVDQVSDRYIGDVVLPPALFESEVSDLEV